MTTRKPSLFARYRKAIIAVAGALTELVALGVLHGTAQTAVTAILAGLAAAGVYAAPNATD